MNDFMIETENLTKFYGQKCALNNLTIKIPAKSISAIVGANGAGKSTLFRILLGTLKASYGKATLLGHDINQLTPNLRGRVGFVNEEHSLPGWLTIKQLAKMQRSDYVNCSTCSRGGQPVQTEAYGQFDASMSYDVNDHFTVFVEGVNITDEDTRKYSMYESRFLSLQDTGARLSAGVRATF